MTKSISLTVPTKEPRAVLGFSIPKSTKSSTPTILVVGIRDSIRFRHFIAYVISFSLSSSLLIVKSTNGKVRMELLKLQRAVNRSHTI